MVRRTIWLAALVGGLLGVNEARSSDWGRRMTARRPVGRPAGAAGAATTAATAGPQAGFFARMCDNLEQCRRKLCAQPAERLLNSLTAPATAARPAALFHRSVQSCPVRRTWPRPASRALGARR